MSTYTHLELNSDIPTPSGYYTPYKEGRIRVDGREVLYIVSQAVIEASCCGVADFASALVPGYVTDWQEAKDSNGLPVSRVEPVKDEHVRDLVRKAIQERENVTQVEFW
jgi:hypothetical protein